MENNRESGKSAISEIVKKGVFEEAHTDMSHLMTEKDLILFWDPSTHEQRIFTKWCEINDSIEPQYISREEWSGKEKSGILQKSEGNGKQKLFLPEDLKLWEMIDIIEAIDEDTFGKSSERIPEKRRELFDLGDTFINMGIYLSQNIEKVEEGKESAIETAKDFYRYGNSLRTGKFNEDVSIEEISGNVLSARQMEEMDKWFGADKLALKSREGNLPKVRKEMLQQYFKVADHSQENGNYKRAIERAGGKFKAILTKPEQELYSAVFRRGAERLISEMGKNGWSDEITRGFEGMGIPPEKSDHKNLREILNIPSLKKELDEVRGTGNIEEISRKELEIAGYVKKVVNNIPSPALEEEMSGGVFPAKMKERQEMICVGATIIGGKLLEDIGINYLVGCSPDHMLTLLITSDNNIYLQDFLTPDGYKPLPESTFSRNGHRITAKELVEYSKSPEGSQPWVSTKFRKKIEKFSLLPPEKVNFGVLENLFHEINNTDYPSAIVSLKKMRSMAPEDVNSSIKEINYLTEMNKYKSAAHAARKLIKIDEEEGVPMLAWVKSRQGNYEGAAELLMKGTKFLKSEELHSVFYKIAMERPSAIRRYLEKDTRAASKLYLGTGEWLMEEARRRKGEEREIFEKRAIGFLINAVGLDSANTAAKERLEEARGNLVAV